MSNYFSKVPAWDGDERILRVVCDLGERYEVIPTHGEDLPSLRHRILTRALHEPVLNDDIVSMYVTDDSNPGMISSVIENVFVEWFNVQNRIAESSGDVHMSMSWYDFKEKLSLNGFSEVFYEEFVDHNRVNLEEFCLFADTRRGILVSACSDNGGKEVSPRGEVHYEFSIAGDSSVLSEADEDFFRLVFEDSDECISTADGNTFRVSRDIIPNMFRAIERVDNDFLLRFRPMWKLVYDDHPITLVNDSVYRDSRSDKEFLKSHTDANLAKLSLNFRSMIGFGAYSVPSRNKIRGMDYDRD